MSAKIILFDADGVLTLPEEMFSVIYARSHGFDAEPFEVFFRTNWQEIVTGKRDLKEAISAQPELWRWDGSVEELLDHWFKSEDIRNEEMLQLVRDLRSNGFECYLATEQERYRGEYMRNVMFKDLFDDYFISADLGAVKSDPKFFELILQRLSAKYPKLSAKDILFFDDSQSKVDAALQVGIDAHLFTSPDQIRELL